MRDLNLLWPAVASIAMASSSFSAAPTGPHSVPSMPGDLCTGGQATGTGLRGAYYTADPRKAGPSLVRVDARVNSDTVHVLPNSPVPGSVQTVRWCGWIRPIASGPHKFHSAAADMRIEVARQVVAGPGVAGGLTVPLEAGKNYAIRMELPAAMQAGDFVLQWTPPFGATLDIPPTVLYPPVETAEPGC
jgi:hypothetical protein